jgi:hypothetical protein
MVYGKSMTDALVSGPGSLISRRSLFKAVGMGTAVLGTVGCSSEPLKRNSLSSTSASSAPATGEPRRGSSRRKWVHFGDSFTRLSQVAPACAAITGFRHMDASITGDNSLTAAIRSGSEPLRARIDGPNIPAQGSVEILDLDPTGFRMLEDWEYKVEIQGVRGAIIRDKPSKKTLFTREREGEAVDVSGQVEILMDPGPRAGYWHREFPPQLFCCFCAWSQRHRSRGSIDDLVKNIRTMIEKHPAADLRYVVTDIPAWQEEKNGTPQREKLDAWNGRLKQEFGDSFIETFRWLIDHRKETFALAEQKMTDRDRAGEGDGVIPASLTLGDRGHLNRAGGKAWAAILVEELKRLHLV